MEGVQLLKSKHAIVFGAAGSIGSGIAREFAAQGAEVFLAGRPNPGLEEFAGRITAAGGKAHVSVVDAEDDNAVDAYVQHVAGQAGSLDIVCNVIGPRVKDYANGTPAMSLTVDQFMLPLTTFVRSQFITSRAAARHMIEQRSGVILFVTGSPARGHTPGTTAIGAAFGAIENFTRNLAYDVSPHGVRVVCVRASAMPDTRSIQETAGLVAGSGNASPEQVFSGLANSTLLKVSPTVADTARVVAFAASDNARMMTGTVLNSSAGAVID
jgi:NAD(P)-dependent dehydrogenase (short-subunit alcohol dehydrogenase family)